MYTSTAILWDLARLFLGLIAMVQVSGNVSVSLPNVELLEIVTCYHLVSLLLNSVLELTGALVLEVAGPRVDG
jgi:hypothetical protein